MTAAEPKETRDYAVPGLVRGLQILRLLNTERRTISVAEIARELGIPRSTVFRLVATLTAQQYLVRDEVSPRFRLGPEVLKLGFNYLNSQGVIEVARPYLESLRDQLQASTHLAILDGRFALYILCTPSNRQFGSWNRLGLRLPAHASSCGRSLLFGHSDQELGALFAEAELEIFSPQTPRTLDELKARLAVERERGCVSYVSAVTPGIASCAAPVYDGSGRIVAAVSVSDMQTVSSLADLDGVVTDSVMATARRMSEAFGFGTISGPGNRRRTA